MKKILQALCLLTLFSSTALIAETTSDSATSKPHLVGVGNCYKLGSKETPITSSEYCAFLNSEKMAGQKNKVGPSYYYDNSFMNWAVGGASESHSAVRSNDCITCHNKDHFQYSVIQGRGDFIINALSSCDNEGIKKYIITNFANWRKNPTAQDLCDVINDEINSRDEETSAIKERYPEAAKKVMGTLDLMTQVIHADATICLETQLSDERNRPVIKFSSESDETSFPGMAVHAVVVEGMEYYRPSVITWY